MPVVFHKHRFVYFSMPKNASTSMKYLLYELETGRAITRQEIHSEFNSKIHNFYLRPEPPERWFPFYEKYMTFVIVRDPVKRALSAYANRILERQVLKRPQGRKAVRKLGLSKMPTLSEYVDRFDDYRRASVYLDSHTVPQSAYVGKFYDKIDIRMPIERLKDVPDIFRERLGVDLELPKIQVSAHKVSTAELTPAQLGKLIDFYKDDYAMLSELYSPDQLPAAAARQV